MHTRARIIVMAAVVCVLAHWTGRYVIAGPGEEDSSEEDRPQIAAICTKYQPFLHSDVIVSKFILNFPTDEGIIEPEVEIASLYLDQGPDDSLGHQLGERLDIPIYSSVQEALTLGGEEDELAVDGVLVIGEHGQYPENEYGQIMYPRMLWLKKVFRVFEASGESVPVYNDKQLAYNWTDAKWVYDRAQELDVPMMAGSVMPVVWRRPAGFEHEPGAEIDEAVVLFHGSIDRYAIHGFELLQSMIEDREGGETGVKRVETLTGDDFHAAMEDGRIPVDMVDHALIEHMGVGLEDRPIREHADDPAAFLVDYRDGLKAVLLQLGDYYQLKDFWGPKSTRWFYAARVHDEIVSCEIDYRECPGEHVGMQQPMPGFSYLGLNIQQMFLTGEPQYPIERTLLTTGLSEAVIQSHHREEPVETPHLAVEYSAEEADPLRPDGYMPEGASTEPWPPDDELRPLFEEWRGN